LLFSGRTDAEPNHSTEAGGCLVGRRFARSLLNLNMISVPGHTKSSESSNPHR